MVSHLSRLFGLKNLDLAEDVVQDTLIRALETWKFSGPPDNPSAWLMRTARNRAIDLIRRNNNFRGFTPDLTYLIQLQEDPGTDDKPPFEQEIRDDELRMMFACCSPELSTDL